MSKIKMTEELIDQIVEAMPHGSGIDYDYNWTKSNGALLLHNAFHNMDEHGGYDGISPFKVHIFVTYETGSLILHKIRWTKSETNPSTYRKYSTSWNMEYLYDTYTFAVEQYNMRFIK